MELCISRSCRGKSKSSGKGKWMKCKCSSSSSSSSRYHNSNNFNNSSVFHHNSHYYCHPLSNTSINSNPSISLPHQDKHIHSHLSINLNSSSHYNNYTKIFKKSRLFGMPQHPWAQMKSNYLLFQATMIISHR